MEYTIGLSFLTISIIYSIVLNFLFFGRKHIKTEETSIFGRIVVINLCGIVLEILCIILTMIFGVEHLASIIINKCFLLYLLLFLYTFSSYVFLISDADGKRERQYNIYNKTGLAMFIISSILTIFLKTHIYYKNGIMYSFGPSVSLVYANASICFFSCTLHLIVNYKTLLKRRNIPIIFFIVLNGVVTLIQRLNPAITLATSAETIVVFLMYHTIENPDIKMIQELEVAREQADKANRSKSDFLSSMSHEIRTPLNAIAGFSDCIIDAKTLPEAKENAKDIINASGTLLEIVNGILDISKIEAGKIEIINSKYNAIETFTELAKLITPRMVEKGLDFTYTIDPNMPKTLIGDVANIKKVVTNILSNACKYTDRGFVHYDISCVNENDVSRLTISVEDSGRGIKKESVEKMFNKFQRLDEDKNTNIEGTGLGLAITKQLTELMGGKIFCHTEYGVGSKFTIVLCQKITSEDNTMEKIEISDTCDLHDIRILIVDDTPLNLKVAIKILEKFNANIIETCNNGYECIARIRDGRYYDLVLLDDMMPKLSGTETLAKLKEIPNYHSFTVALTANAITGMREKYIASGFDDYISKPIEKSELIRVVDELNGMRDTTSITTEQTKEDISNDISPEEKNKIIRVPDNIEEILGAKLDLSDRSDSNEVVVNNSAEPAPTENLNGILTPITPIDLTTNKEISPTDLTPIVETLPEENKVEELDKNQPTTQAEEVEELDLDDSSETTTIIQPVVPTEEVARVEEQVSTENQTSPVELVPIADLEIPKEETTTSIDSKTYDRAYLEANGADVNHGLELLGDMEMYNETIHDFFDEVDEKWARILDNKAKNDMPNYAIDVHSLKSDCKYLGFMKLADIAYQHELKSKENDSAFVNDNFAELETEYNKVHEVVKNYISANPVS